MPDSKPKLCHTVHLSAWASRSPHKLRVLIDGVEIKRVVNVRVDAGVKTIAKVTLEFEADVQYVIDNAGASAHA